jgi:AcrR family transcriptional regulator
MSGRGVEMLTKIGRVRMAGADCPKKDGKKMATGSNAASLLPRKPASLLAAARQLFAQKGYDGATVREIAALAGVTKPILYYYFGNKEGIYFELIREPFAKLDALLHDSLQWGGSAKARLEQLCDHLFYLFTEHLELLNLIQGPSAGSPYYDFEAGYRRLQNAIRRLILEGIEQQEFQNANAKAGASAIIGGLYMATQEWLKDRKMGITQKRFPGILRIIFNGIGMDGVKAESK